MQIGASSSASDYWNQNAIQNAYQLIDTNLLQLSTLKRINRGSDDPAGMIDVEQLNSQMRALTAAQSNTSRASGMVHVADSGMSQANDLMTDINSLLVEAANTGTISSGQRDALQMQIDAAVEALDRIGATTSYGDRNLLDGSAGFELSGVNPEQINNIEVLQNVGGGSNTLDIEVTQAAQAGSLTLGPIAAGASGSFSVTGSQGTSVIEVQADMSAEQIAEQINGQSPQTGVSATVEEGEIILQGDQVGSSAYIEVSPLHESLGVVQQRAYGTDVQATVNGQMVTGQENTINISSGAVQADITFKEEFEGDVDAVTVSGDASRFVFSTDVSRSTQLGLPQVSSVSLGSQQGRLSDIVSGGKYDLRSGNFAEAQSIVKGAQSTLLGYQARAGAFEKYTIESSQNILDSMEENVASAMSFYDTDIGVATSNLARGNIMLQAAVQSAAINNFNRSMAVSLLSSTNSSFNPWGWGW